MGNRMKYYFDAKRVNVSEFGDNDLLDELKSAYSIFLDNTNRKGKLVDFKKAVEERWSKVIVHLLI